MGVFENFEKIAVVTYKTTAMKTNKLAKQTKLKLTINEDKCAIEELYNEMGKQLYLNHRLGKIDKKNDEMIPKLKKSCLRIDALSNEIEESRLEILRLNNLKVCCNCYCEIDIESNYCQNCGMNQLEEVSKQESYNNSKEKIKEKLENGEIENIKEDSY